jgi:hypothetical protein
MEEPYQDSPASTRPSSSHSSPSSTTKPLPDAPNAATVPPFEPYRDEPSPAAQAPILVAPQPQHLYSHRDVQVFFPPYTDAPSTSEDSDEVPLAHLYPYPTEAPPSYSVAVRQSYRDTLVSHIPGHAHVSPELDEEEAVDTEYHDDVRFKVERVVASLIVAIVLLGFTGVFVGLFISIQKKGW